jgi:hypothetical protein
MKRRLPSSAKEGSVKTMLSWRVTNAQCSTRLLAVIMGAMSKVNHMNSKEIARRLLKMTT